MNINELGTFLEKYTYETLLEQALDRVPEGIDIREGSIIYDALAPSCYQLADFYMQLKNVLLDIFAQTASGEYLDLKVSEYGVKRFNSTAAIRLASFLDTNGEFLDVPIGARFSTFETNGLIFEVLQMLSKGNFLLRCDTDGAIGNTYHGPILPVDNINGLATATIGEVSTPGQNEETDDELRSRFFNFVNQKSFGGNFSDYVTNVGQIEGIGGQQIYPVWDGPGSVKVVIIDSDLNITTQTFIDKVKELLDPNPYSGEGMGLAPIGHKITVTTAEALTVNVVFSISLMAGYNLDQVRPALMDVMRLYFVDLRGEWSSFTESNAYHLSVYRSQLVAGLVKVPGVANIDNMEFNEQAADVNLIMTNDRSQLPFLGEVTINES
ncbi:Uncharacterized phage protein gp47/JayE [Amphibacillus marinus]|uniref:Uncharacterized phage protein gp47/JayE n=1 Tax=Amphibacillus marinus TaxID=872970 RepID=A0A1H8IXT3_9BACI|nr:baseplate J/gp47 family protein [Amphibacillus marinus]SEN73404.1 Uncharacterized phage protein gp47/JayE [Amphibacillus marinus]